MMKRQFRLMQQKNHGLVIKFPAEWVFILKLDKLWQPFIFPTAIALNVIIYAIKLAIDAPLRTNFLILWYVPFKLLWEWDNLFVDICIAFIDNAPEYEILFLPIIMYENTHVQINITECFTEIHRIKEILCLEILILYIC